MAKIRPLNGTGQTMKHGTIQDLERAAGLVAKCEPDDVQDQAELAEITRQLQGLIYKLNGAAVRKVAGL